MERKLSEDYEEVPCDSIVSGEHFCYFVSFVFMRIITCDS